MKKTQFYLFLIFLVYNCKIKNNIKVKQIKVGYKKEPIEVLSNGQILKTNLYSHVFIIFETEKEIEIKDFNYVIKQDNKDAKITEQKKYLVAKSEMQQTSKEICVSFKCVAKTNRKTKITVIGKLKNLKDTKEASRIIEVIAK